MRHRKPPPRLAGRPLALLVLVTWLAMTAWLAPRAGGLSERVLNDGSEIASSSTESVRADRYADAITGSNGQTALVAYRRTDGLTPADLRRIAADRAAVAALPGVGPALPPAAPSPDGAAALLPVPLDGEVPETVRELRALLPDRDGLEVAVGGTAGVNTDLEDVFAQIDGTLLLVSVAVVLVILLVVYRSPTMWIPSLLCVVVSDVVTSAIVDALVDRGLVRVYGLSLSVMTVLVFGAGTDYALLLVARLREEYRHGGGAAAVYRAAWASSGALVASATTVAGSLLCLLVAETNLARSLAVVGAIGVLVCLLCALTLLPALLILGGPALFWPRRPLPGAGPKVGRTWPAVNRLIARKARPLWLLVTAAMLVGGAAVPTLRSDWPSVEQLFTVSTDSAEASRTVAAHFPALPATATVTVRAAYLDAAQDRLTATEGVVSAQPWSRPGSTEPGIHEDRALVEVRTAAAEETAEADRLIRRIRAALAVLPPEAEVAVGGRGAERVDGRDSAAEDRRRVLPLALGVILVLLMVLLRALLAPLLLVATVALSLLATIGVSRLVFQVRFDNDQVDNTFVLFTFVFLASLGADYNIFLIARVREETERLGTRAGLVAAVNATGGVITSAGLVLAATFAALITLPMRPLFEVGFAVALGVLIDTLVVRSILVPALFHDLGARVWWPAREPDERRSQPHSVSSRPRGGTEVGSHHVGEAPASPDAGRRTAMAARPDTDMAQLQDADEQWLAWLSGRNPTTPADGPAAEPTPVGHRRAGPAAHEPAGRWYPPTDQPGRPPGWHRQADTAGPAPWGDHPGRVDRPDHTDWHVLPEEYHWPEDTGPESGPPMPDWSSGRIGDTDAYHRDWSEGSEHVAAYPPDWPDWTDRTDWNSGPPASASPGRRRRPQGPSGERRRGYGEPFAHPDHRFGRHTDEDDPVGRWY